MNSETNAKEENTVHVVLSTDSLSFPRPWNQKLLNEQPSQFFKYEHTYPALLRHHLRLLAPKTDVLISNLGRRASSISHLTAVARDILSWMSPDVTIIHHGIVDCWIRDPATLERRTSERAFEEALDQFFALRNEIAPDLTTIAIGILETNRRMIEKFPQQNAFIETYNLIIREKAASNGALFADLAEGCDDPMQLVHEDGHHLSRAGHARAASLLAGMIEAAVPAMSDG